MKFTCLFATALLLFSTACGSKSTSNPLQSVITAAQGAICPLAQEFADEAGAKLAGLTGAANPLACGAALYQPLVNSQICTQPIPQADTPMLKALVAAHPEWKTIGDIPKSALSAPAVKALAVHAQGIISSVMCPIGVGVGMGIFSTSIPAACQGPNNLSASATDTQFTAVCAALTQSLP